MSLFDVLDREELRQEGKKEGGKSASQRTQNSTTTTKRTKTANKTTKAAKKTTNKTKKTIKGRLAATIVERGRDNWREGLLLRRENDEGKRRKRRKKKGGPKTAGI